MSATSGKTLLIMAGGTGGHVYPALATADLLRAQGVRIEWLGTERGIEARVVPAAKIPLHCIQVQGLRGKGVLRLLTAPLNLLRATWQARKILKQVQPQAVLGMGGFASGPGGLAAWSLGIPVLIHEQNAYPGMTNKTLARFAQRVYQAFPSAFAELPLAQTIGNPVRGPILELPAPEQRFAERSGPLRVLVVGGSLGAQAINQCVPQALALLPEATRPQVWHQTGIAHHAPTEQRYAELNLTARVVPFIEEMDQALAWADLVVCRSGALTVSELAIAGVASILVPFPHAVDDHQTANARFLQQAGAAELVPQSDLNAESLAALFTKFNDRALLLDMAQKARSQGQPQASQALADACIEVMQ
ncbi:undecaprenyldiphospho-muramoylpentapeptide beta-N-acetylglucosaminyltransferase [Nitrincola tapanii]|uniref:UDP-N-acetylglucosamine--N-acetylmuramyl-(pentapeptide) pyrophosphoryl-undecaprenol N-acetylglucosamine transferase n=1 Tax=Nitrincola tapanii TaxID=1708751 RepID=A0A5A9W038_9GAMM|nr:undecaprenyldiphospho-muramoylpentapeptide beta-N-acetylglucosaminyltransferase [Nitrincola tapanii]KAA0873932.1 undecaprenyldiphospho-muramoylpentapeptide beta-N-acetylglucosaminyltransferase [Nitrincola tapanii]